MQRIILCFLLSSLSNVQGCKVMTKVNTKMIPVVFNISDQRCFVCVPTSFKCCGDCCQRFDIMYDGQKLTIVENKN